MFQKMSVPILGLVENMSSYICPKCSHEAPIFGSDGAAKLAETLNVPCLGKVPFTITRRNCGHKQAEGQALIHWVHAGAAHS